MLKPLGKDVLLRFTSTNAQDTTKGGIVLVEQKNPDYEIYEVAACGPDVDPSLMVTGDRVMTSWAKLTPPFTHEGKRYAVTSTDEIWAVLDEDE